MLVLAVAARYLAVHVYACSAHWLRPALPSNENSQAALWQGVAARNQARRFPHDGAADAAGVRLFTRKGNWTGRFPLIAAAVSALSVNSCLLDGEAVA